jgi:hypothetical protein
MQSETAAPASWAPTPDRPPGPSGRQRQHNDVDDPGLFETLRHQSNPTRADQESYPHRLGWRERA